ncbi:MAG: S8 family serine peptidase, partial [Bacteroidales bacterium]
NENVSTPSYPASYRGVISVGSCDFDKKRSEFSNYGSLVDILAPGGMGPQEGTEIFSTTFSPNQWFRLAGLEHFSGQYYENMIGTSMACPIAASLCALMLSKDSSLNHYDIRQILMSTAQISLHSSIVENSGVIDAAAAMEALETYIKPSMPIYLKALSADVEKGNLAAQISWTVNEQNAKPDFFRLYRDNVLLVDNISVNQLKFQDSSARSNFSHCYELCEVLNGKETYKLEAIYHAPVRFRVFLMAVPEEGGVVSGSGIYDFGDYATLVAKPNPGYQFLYWRLNGGVFNERDSIAVRVGANANLQAIFVKSTKLEEANMVEQNLAVYPNPNSGRISIDLRNNEIPKQLKIYDLSGRKVLQLNKQEINSISIESLKSGIYLLRVETENNVYTNKIIKK